MKFFLKPQNTFPVLPYQFTIFDLWRTAFKMGYNTWLMLLAADIIFIVVMNMPIWMPLLGEWFPWL